MRRPADDGSASMENDSSGPLSLNPEWRRRSPGDSPSAKKHKMSAGPEKKHKPSRFSILPHSRYDSPFPYFAEPKEAGCFSLDGNVSGDWNVYNDSRKLKYYIPPREGARLDYNLRQGYKEFIMKDEDLKQRLNHLLHWILKNRREFPQDRDGLLKSLNTDFLMWRGHLTKIICTPYAAIESWAMAVTLFRGTYYMSEVETETNEKRRKEMNPLQEEMCYWGYKFEQYLTSDEVSGTPDTSKPVDNHDAFCTVIRSALSRHRLLYSGEVDCVRSDSRHKSPKNYVELKTTREWSHERQRRNFSRFKLIKWWAQSFLVGIPEVVCGFRDDNGIVRRLDTFHTMQMHREPFVVRRVAVHTAFFQALRSSTLTPSNFQHLRSSLIQSDQVNWNGAAAFNFCDQFLSFVREVVTEDDPNRVYLFERTSNSDHVSWRILHEPSDVFLPQWYTSQFAAG